MFRHKLCSLYMSVPHKGLSVPLYQHFGNFFLTVSPYDPDSRFSMNSLTRLEGGAGIKIVTSLAEIPARLAAAIGVAGEEQQVEIVIGKWESGQSQHSVTWRSLLDVLRRLDLEDLSQEIEDYMHGE